MSPPPRDVAATARVARFAVGIGARLGVEAGAVRALLDRVLTEHGLDPRDAAFATVEVRADEPGLREAVRALVEAGAEPEDARAPGGVGPGGVDSGGVDPGDPDLDGVDPGGVAPGGPDLGGVARGGVSPGGVAPGGAALVGVMPGGSVAGCLTAWWPDQLATETVSSPSGRVARAVGTPSVAEAAALRTARTLPGAIGSELVVPKTVGDGVTVAVARPSLEER